MKTLTKRNLILKIMEKKEEVLKNIDEEEIDELVDADGSIINGVSNGYNDVEIHVSPDQTTDKFVDDSRQGNQYLRGYGRTQFSSGTYAREGEENDGEVIEELDEAAIEMKKMVEDILSKKRTKSNDLVPKTKKSFKELISTALEDYSEEKDTEIYQFLNNLKENL